MNKNYLKIIIPITIIVIAFISFIISLNFSTSKIIEISANSDIKINLNRFNKIVSVEGLDANGKNVVENITAPSKSASELLNKIIESSINLYPLEENDSVNILFVSKNLQKDKTLIKDLSTELSLISSELSINAPINQYKLTKKDYGVISDLKKSTGYKTFDILQQGFISKEETPYITSIIFKSDCYFINFSDDIVFNGQEEIICKNGDNVYETTPAGYSKSTLALFIDNIPPNTPLSFDVSIKDHENLFGYAITPAETNNQDNIDVTYSLDYDKNLARLTDLKQQIIEADITEHDRYDLLNKYDMLSNTINRIATSDDLSDFNIMCDNLENDIAKAIENNKKNDEIEKNTNYNSTTSTNNSSNSNTTTSKPVVPPTPTPTEPVDTDNSVDTADTVDDNDTNTELTNTDDEIVDTNEPIDSTDEDKTEDITTGNKPPTDDITDNMSETSTDSNTITDSDNPTEETDVETVITDPELPEANIDQETNTSDVPEEQVQSN